MIKNYLYTIGKYLTPSQRDEVLQEIEANLYDYLEENFGKKEYTDGEIESALRAMGHPKSVAEAYQNTPRSIIGSAYIDTYWLVVKIALIGTAIGLTVGHLLKLTSAENGVQVFTRLFTDIISSGLGTFGMITLIFVLIQHYSPETSTTKESTWKLSELEKAPESHQKVSLFDLVFETFFICFGLVVINSAAPVFMFSLNGSKMTSLINMDVFAPYVVLITIALVASLLLNIYLLIRRQWQISTRIISIILDIFGVGILTKIALTPEIWDLKAITDVLGKNATVETWFSLSINIGVAVMVIITAFSIFGHLKAIFKK
jgi:hypothetical protein